MTVIHKATSISEIGDDRTARFIASDESVDRYGDIIEVDGWDTKAFKKNPQFLFGHKSSALPIGKVLRTWKDGTKFMADITFTPEGMDEFADKVFKFLKGGFLSAVSVGFSPKKEEPIYNDKGRYIGTRYIKQELLELSLVPIPANPNALQIAKGMELSQKDYDLLFRADPGTKDDVDLARSELDILKLRLSS